MEYQAQWAFLQTRARENNLAHAYLFSGQDANSINGFAKSFVKNLHCLQEKTCNTTCVNCKLIEGGGFPDAMFIRSADSKSSLKNEKDMMEISIEQIRQAQNFLAYKPYYPNGVKAVIIEDADLMSVDAQNCFLKSLEEPKGRTFIALVSGKPEMLLPTIASRCQHMKFSATGYEVLDKEEEGILRGLMNILDADLAEKFTYVKKANLEGRQFGDTLKALQKYFRNVMLAKIGVLDSPQYTMAVAKYPMEKVRKIITAIETANHQARLYNINVKMALEMVLMEI